MITPILNNIIRFKALGFLLLIFFSSNISKSNPDKNNKITVVFRFDDYSAISDTELELKIIEAFRSKGMAFTVGVIPYVCKDSFFDSSPQELMPLDSLKGKILQSAYEDGTIEIGLHGYSHQTIKPGKNNTEFSGLDFEEQIFRIKKGMELLKNLTGITVTTFIPPWNRYDLSTIKALEQLNFITLSASTIGTADKSSQLKIVPNTCELFQLKDAVEYARKSTDTNPYIIVLFHWYDFSDSKGTKEGLTFSMFSELLEWVEKQKDIKTKTVHQAATTTEDFDVNRFFVNIEIVDLNIHIPPFVRPVVTGLYVNSSDLNKMRLRVIFFYLILILIFMVIAGFIFKKLFVGKTTVEKILKYGITILLILAFFYTIIIETAGYKVLVGDTILLGACSGIWISTLFKQVKNIELKKK